MLNYNLDLSGSERDVVLPDLVAEGAALDANVLIALRTPDAFDVVLKQVAAAGSQSADLDAAARAAKPRAELLEQWRTGRTELAAALRDAPIDHEFPWFGSQLTAELMVPNPGQRGRLLPPSNPPQTPLRH
jgi:hypothetical protein